MAFSPDSRYAVSGSEDGWARLWDVQTGVELHRFSDRKGMTVKVVSFSPDGKEIIVGESSRQNFRVVHWDTATYSLTRQFSANLANISNENAYVTGMALSTDASYAVIVDVNLQAWWFDTQASAQGQQPKPFTARPATGNRVIFGGVALSPDGKYLLDYGAGLSHVQLWDSQTGTELGRFSGPGSPVTSLALSADGKSILAGSADHTLWLWDIQRLTRWAELFGIPQSATVLNFSPDGQSSLVPGSSDSSIEVRNTRTGALLRVLDDRGDLSPKFLALFSSDSRYVLMGQMGHYPVSLWDLQSGDRLRTFVTSGFVTGEEISPDGRYLLVADLPPGAGARTLVWDLWDNRPPEQFPGLGEFSPDSRRLLTQMGGIVNAQGKLVGAATDLETGARLWDIATGQELGRFTDHHEMPGASGFSPDGKYVVTLGSELTAVWDAQTYRLLYALDNPGAVLPVFSPDATMLLSVSWDYLIRLQDARTGSLLRQFHAPSPVDRLLFTPDGRFIIALHLGWNQVWDTDYRESIRYICARLIRDFTDAERAQYGIEDKEPTCPQFGAQTIPPAWTPIPTQTLPVWTPIPSNTPGSTPTLTPYPTFELHFPPTATYEPTATP